MRRRRISAPHDRTPAISQRNGLEYPANEMVKEHWSGLWVHKSEVTEWNPQNLPRKPKIDAVLLKNPLPPNNERHPANLNPWTGGRLGINVSVADTVDLSYSRHIQNPEAHFYTWNLGENETIGSNFSTDTPLDLPNGQDDNILDGIHRIAYRFLESVSNAFRIVLAFPQGRHDPTHFYVGDNMFDQKGVLTRSNDVTIYGSVYHTVVTGLLKPTITSYERFEFGV